MKKHLHLSALALLFAPIIHGFGAPATAATLQPTELDCGQASTQGFQVTVGPFHGSAFGRDQAARNRARAQAYAQYDQAVLDQFVAQQITPVSCPGPDACDPPAGDGFCEWTLFATATPGTFTENYTSYFVFGVGWMTTCTLTIVANQTVYQGCDVCPI